MKDLQTRCRLATALTLVMTAGVLVSAQEKPALDPEAIAILGDPNASQASLDANIVEVLGRPEGAPPPGSAINAQAADIAAKLRCPVCQGVSIADSPSGMATNMRGQVRDLVAKGYSEE
ncbi:MAG: cytochrome c-type biogenesis protein CcmH, partial [Vicinamibacteria bacterium]|nr:cytochrome c-type biogenesis protein CcmH [Vicinamibacteria bacterium]